MEDEIIFEFNSTIGNLKFRYICYGDFQFIRECLSKKETDEKITRDILYNQISNKKEFENLYEIKTEELEKIVYLFLEHEETFDEIVSEKTYENKFEEFIQLLKRYFVGLDNLHKSINKIFQPLESVFLKYNKKIEEIYKPIMMIQNSYNNILQRNITSQLNTIEVSFNNRYRNLFKSIDNLLINQKNLWEKLSSNIEINKEKATENLEKYNWFINGSMPGSFISKVSRIEDKDEINRLFVDYHLQDDYKVLDQYLTDWNENPLLSRRVGIIKDVISIFKKMNDNKEINVNNVVVPVLINQIEGLKHDYMRHLGFQREGSHHLDTNRERKSWADVYSSELEKRDDFMNLTFKIFKDILFGNENETSTPTLNRHKISHGSTEYGFIETTIWCLMILEFMNNLTYNP